VVQALTDTLAADPRIACAVAFGSGARGSARPDSDVDVAIGLAYRIFRDGITLLSRDTAALNARRARAVLEYLEFRPVEELCARGVLAAAHGR